jgi:sugar phosphate isomerase/epimerase
MIYVSTACVRTPRGLWDVLAAYARAGLTRVELGACTLGDDGDLQARLRAARLEFLVHNYFPPLRDEFVLNLASPERALAQRSFDFALQALELCAELGAPLYSVHSGFVMDPVGREGSRFVIPEPSSPGDAERALERLAEALTRLLERADELGVRLALENLDVLEYDAGRIVPATPESFRALFTHLGRLGLLLDTGHLAVTARTLAFEPDAFVNAVAPWVAAVHAHANDGSRDRHLPVSERGWVLPVLRRPEFAALPIVVEARFDDAAALASHVEWLGAQLEV